MICYQWEKVSDGLKYCADVYRNPDGTPEGKDDFLWINDFGIFTWSPVD
jgi:hypothetical protein